MYFGFKILLSPVSLKIL